MTGNAAANKVASEADLIIGVGTRFTDFTTGSKQLFQAPDVEFLTVNLSEFHAGKLDATKLVADARTALEELTLRLDVADYRAEYRMEIKVVKDEWQKELTRLSSISYNSNGFQPEVAGHLDEALPEYEKALGSSLTQSAVIAAINNQIADDAIIVGSSGSLPGDLQRMWVSREPNTYHMEYGYSCMGYEISGALGVKMAAPQQEVYTMVGDGSYLMLHSELVTSLQEGLKINVLLFDNVGFGCINNLQMGNGMGSFGTEFRTRNPNTRQLSGELMSIDFAQSAAGYGVKTYTARTMEELKDALANAKQQACSTLIDIKVLPKTMTDGYGAWWHVGVAELSQKASIQEAYAGKEKMLKRARKY